MEGIHAIVLASNTISTWCLSLLGGTLLAILSTSYIKPVGKWAKFIYLLFVPGWFFLKNTLEAGDTITRRGVMAAIRTDLQSEIIEKMNNDFVSLLENFHLALLFFGAWLLLYLAWWVIQDFLPKQS